MRIAIGADHRGLRLKKALKEHLESLGHTVLDLGTDRPETVDYPDYAHAVARTVASRRVRRGVLVCGTGIGMSMAANRTPGVRAALCCSDRMARMSRRHNNANVLCLGADLLGLAEAKRILVVWLGTRFEGGRHARRTKKLDSPTDQRTRC
ncbi:MAG: ribose 5-phosphate isomerase B [candidate division WOR-3 bacterium]|nr:MAG: ribose 5-phosphate isomerase B [candidate division WOR-3 bacterium]